MEKADYFKVYGYLPTRRDIFEQKARDAAQRGDEVGDNALLGYKREIIELNRLMSVVNDEGYSL